MKGFTLLEILIGVAILAIISAVAISQFSATQQKVSLDAAANDIVSYLRQAQGKSIARESDQSWGVKFDSDADGQFYQIYSAGGTTENKIYLPAEVEYKDLTLPQQIQFDELTGARSSDSTITSFQISSTKTSESRTISVNPAGKIAISQP